MTEISVESTEIRLIDRDGTWVFRVKLADDDVFFLHARATAEDMAAAIHAARARQIRRGREQADARPAVVGDVLGVNDPIPDNVVEVENRDGRWRRAVGDDRYPSERGQLDTSQVYDWITVGGGGWTTDDGLYDYAPITVTKVA